MTEMQEAILAVVVQLDNCRTAQAKVRQQVDMGPYTQHVRDSHHSVSNHLVEQITGVMTLLESEKFQAALPLLDQLELQELKDIVANQTTQGS